MSNMNLKAGTKVWVIERDCDGDPCDVAGYMFIASACGVAIVSPYINDAETIEETLAIHLAHTADEYYSFFSAFLLDDCYLTKEAAEAYMNQIGEDGHET